jgi:hypothetical protein
MPTTTTLRLKFVDVLGAPLKDHSVTVDLFSFHTSQHFHAMVPLSGQTDVAIQLQDCVSDLYRIQLSAANYRFLQFFLRLEEGETNTRAEPVVFPVDPDQVVDITAPAFEALDGRLRNLLAGSTITGRSGADLYGSLGPLLKAALLNLFVKSSRTILGDRTSCFDHIHNMIELDQDRLFAQAEPALLEETMQSKLFHQVDPSLHKDVPPYHVFLSCKTREPHGNLQLTFSRKSEDGSDYLADMDIDEAQGIEHVFEVIHNSVAGLTNPYNVREILAMQGIAPLYGFRFAELGVAQVAASARG